ncbi:unnamed protein product [Clavelina lepadiformis]|uniref:RNA-polymerase II-associated protein 3-like C-terminal domain-containing protein n=1 Tax=Clavelina lepadiformis TaxID=159417 RepID=A0ABP0G6S6_CLALP
MILDRVSVDQIPVMEFDRAFLILQHLARAQRFDMAAMFLSQSDKNNVGEVVGSLANSVESQQVSFDISDVNRLRACYNIYSSALRCVSYYSIN